MARLRCCRLDGDSAVARVGPSSAAYAFDAAVSFVVNSVVNYAFEGCWSWLICSQPMYWVKLSSL